MLLNTLCLTQNGTRSRSHSAQHRKTREMDRFDPSCNVIININIMAWLHGRWAHGAAARCFLQAVLSWLRESRSLSVPSCNRTNIPNPSESIQKIIMIRNCGQEPLKFPLVAR